MSIGADDSLNVAVKRVAIILSSSDFIMQTYYGGNYA